MSHLSFFIFSTLLFLSIVAFPQKKWDGGGGNNVWNNALNWSGNTIPVEADNILLDNSVVTGSYTVLLPTLAVAVRSITIAPGAGKSIELILPPQNTLMPGLTVNGPGYGMVINAGGIFRNSSGAASGNAVKISDSIKINNDGKYIHNTSSGHAANVQVMSMAPGTEKGAFELNIPTASSTISLSGRTFGKLILNASAAGGICNYTAAGSTRVLIKDELQLGSGVTLNLNFSDTIFVMGDLNQAAGTFNLGNSIKAVVLQVTGNVTQEIGGVITESGSAAQSIVLAGGVVQLATFRGSIQNQVALVRKGTGMALLKSAVSLPYKLVLKSGAVVATEQWPLTLEAACSVEADSLNATSFVAGPLKKEGLSNAGFLFPVGSGNKLRWVRLEQATGTFTVEYFKDDPGILSGNIGSGLHHISRVEYWNISTSSGSNAVVKLSFADPHSGGVTDIADLRVGRLVNGTWQNAGNAGQAGTPGSNGWVSSTAASGFSVNNKTFTLASAIGQENPLPLVNISLTALRRQQHLFFRWEIEKDVDAQTFELQESDDGKSFTTFGSVDATGNGEKYSFLYLSPYIKPYYRVRMKTFRGSVWYESAIFSMKRETGRSLQIEGANRVTGQLNLAVTIDKPANLQFCIFSSSGILQKTLSVGAKEGSSLVAISLTGMKPGLYFLKESTGMFDKGILRFVVQ